MSYLGDVLGFEKFNLKDMLGQLKSHPQRALLGAIDPASTKVWNTALGSHYEPIVDSMGGAYGGHPISAFGSKDGGVYARAQAAGINTKPGGQIQDLAHVIAAFYLMGGGAAGGAAGGEAGAAGGEAGAAGGAAEGAGGEAAGGGLFGGSGMSSWMGMIPSGGGGGGDSYSPADDRAAQKRREDELRRQQMVAQSLRDSGNQSAYPVYNA